MSETIRRQFLAEVTRGPRPGPPPGHPPRRGPPAAGPLDALAWAAVSGAAPIIVRDHDLIYAADVLDRSRGRHLV